MTGRGARAAIQAIEVYRSAISPTRPPSCRYSPTCSAYAVEAITNAKRPLLMVGAGANRKTTSKMLREFVDALGIPFFTTQMGKGVVDETHPLWLGNAALSSGDFVHRAIEKADCIINVGHDVIEKPPFFMNKGLRTVIHVNYFGAEVDTVYFPQVEVIGDIANSVWRMVSISERQRSNDEIKSCSALRDFGFSSSVSTISRAAWNSGTP